MTYQELIRVIDGSGTAVSGATVKITINSTVYTGTTNTKGYVQFSGLPAQNVTSATVQCGSYATLTYGTVASPEAVLVYTNPSSDGSGSQQNKVNVTVSKTGEGTVEYLGAGTGTNPYTLTSGDTAMFSIIPADGYELTAATWGSENVLESCQSGIFTRANVTENKTLSVTFTAITSTDGIGNVKFTTRNLFDTQRSAAFPQNGRIMNFYGLKAPYDNSLHTVTLTSGQYIKFELISSVETAGKTDAFYNSVHWYSGATKQQVGEAAYVKEVLYGSDDVKIRDLGTGMIWAYENESFGFLFTALDGSYASSAGIGTLFTFKPVTYGSHLTQTTNVIKPLPYDAPGDELDWNNYKPVITPDNGQNIDDTYDYSGIVLDENGDPKSNVEVNIVIGDDTYTATTDDQGHFTIPDLPYDSNGDLTIDGKDAGKIDLTDDDTNGFGNDSTERTDTGDDTNVYKNDGTTYEKMDKVTVTIVTGANGSASQSTTSVSYGSSLGVFFTANTGYKISKIAVNALENADALTAGGYMFSNITTAQTIESTFVAEAAPGANQGTVTKDTVVEPGDPTTTMNNSVDDLEKNVLTEAEKTRVTNGENATIYLEVTDISNTISAEEKALIEKKADKGSKLLYLDISLFKKVGNDEAQRVTKTGSKISVSIKIPSAILNTDTTKTRTYQIVKVHDGVASIIEGTYDEKTQIFTFETDEFSTYAIAYKDTAKDETTNTDKKSEQNASSDTNNNPERTESPLTGDNTPTAWLFILTIVSGTGLIILGRKKKTVK